MRQAPIACRHTVSGSISLPSPGFFSPFPHGTSPLSVIGRYLALEGGPPSFPRGFSCPVVLRIPLRYIRPFAYRPITCYGGAFHPASAESHECYLRGPTTPAPECVTRKERLLRRPKTSGLLAMTVFFVIASEAKQSLAYHLFWVGFGLFPVRSPLLGESRLISLPPGTEMFHFPGFAAPQL